MSSRFRTYFPDAYKQHYPNAKTHLSTKVRSTLPDGSPLFEKTRSKKRRPFTEEEDRALRAGYEKHGTVWAAIAKDPIFQEQNRRSTDLRDRFRNAFPDLYLKAGYKPRTAALKKKQIPVRAATDDQVGMSTTGSGLAGPRRKRRNTSQGLLRGGTKSVPQSTAPSEDEDSEDEGQMNLDDSQSQTWSMSSGLDTPTHSSLHAWSPTSSHLSVDQSFMNSSSQSSPFQSRGIMGTMIGKSAWGTDDWFSPNPRLDPSSSNTSLNNSSLDSFDNPPSLSPTPSSPFSFHALSHGVLDRYDLVPTSFSFGHLGHEFGSASEIGGDNQSTFSDDIGMHQSAFRGFTHHSNYAGDLIFGARTHQPQPFNVGLGLLGMQEISHSTGINPMQLHTPLDELELTGINLNDAAPTDILLAQDAIVAVEQPQHDSLTLDDLVDLDLSLPEPHATPPGTPLLSQAPRHMRSMRTRSVNLNTGNIRFDTSSLHGRSVSVPPGEERDRVGRPPPTQQTETAVKPRAPPSALSAFLTPLVYNSGLPPQPSQSDNQLSSSDLYDLPFLDLHYNAYPLSTGGDIGITTGQALDLASSTRPAGVATTVVSPSSLLGPEPSVPLQNRNLSRNANHQRGQSAVCPQDLLVRSKRKRASWEGGTG